MTDPSGRAELDIEAPGALEAYLRARGLVGVDERVSTRPLAGGVSSKILLVETAGGDAWVVKQALAKLRVAADWYSDPRRVHREALGLRWLAQLLPPGASPALVFEDEDAHVLAMEAIAQPHENLKTILLSEGPRGGLCGELGALLGRLHRAGAERRSEIEAVFSDRSYFQSLRIEPYYSYSATREPAAAHFLHELIAVTEARGDTLVHGDFSPKNVLVRHGRLILIDHEVIHFGDGAFDLGFALAHLLSKAHHRRDRRADFARAAAEFWNGYGRTVGGMVDGLAERAVRHTLACLLARARGRSPLEYLSEGEKDAQVRAVLALLGAPPDDVDGAIAGFLGGLPP